MSVDLIGVSPSVHALAAAAATVAAVDVAEVPGAQAVTDLRALMAVSEQLQVAVLGRLRDMDNRQLYVLDAFGSTVTWAAAERTSVSREDVTLSRRLGRLPAVREALESGRLSVTVAQRVQRAVEKVRGFLDQPSGLIDGLDARAVLDAVIVDGCVQLCAESLGGVDDNDPRLRRLWSALRQISLRPCSEVERVEAAFVEMGLRLEGRDLTAVLDRLVDALLPMQLEDKAEQAHHNRGLALLPNAGMPGGRVEIELDGEGWEHLVTALNAAMATDPDNVEDTALAAGLREAGSEDPYAPELGARPRSMLARRHDALQRILADWLGSGIAGTRGKVVPHINVTVGLGTLERLPGALPARGTSGQSLAASLVKRLMCDSVVTRFVMSLGNRVIEMSHGERTIKGHERQAKLVEVGGRCQTKGCVHPPGIRLIPHHPDAWARTHTTSFYDTVMFCESCHHDIHEGGLTLTLRDGRLLGADGWVPQIHVAA